jgi:hypothetical protein
MIFGGGVIEACGDFMLPIIEQTIREHVAPGNGRPLRLLVSQLGDDAVALGAAALAEGAAERTANAPADSAGAVLPADGYPRIEAPEFGSAMVDGTTYAKDVVVRADGSLRKRRKELSREVHGTAHEVSVEELKYVCKGAPQRLVVGMGYEGLLTLSRDARRWLEKKGIELLIEASPQAADTFNRSPGRKALLLHVGC